MVGTTVLAIGGVVLFAVAWIIGFISGHSRGKLEAYEEQHEREASDGR
jgi:hypothetical protein